MLDTHEILLEKSNPNVIKMKSYGENFRTVNIEKKGAPALKDIQLEKLWPNGKPLSKEKIKDLKELLRYVPSYALPKYAFLEDVAEGDFLDDIDGFGGAIDFELEE